MIHGLDRKGIVEHLNLDNVLGAGQTLNQEAAEANELRKMLTLAVPGLLLGGVLPAVLFASAAETLLVLTLIGTLMLLIGLRHMKDAHPLFVAAYSLAVTLTVLNTVRFGMSLLPGVGVIGQELLAIFGGIAAFTGFGVALGMSLGLRQVLDDAWLPAVLLPVCYGALVCLAGLAYSPLVLGIKLVLGVAVTALLFRTNKLAKTE